MVLGILFSKGVVEKIGDGFPKNRLRGKNREQKPEKPASWKKLRAKIRKIRQDGKNTKIVSKPSTFAKLKHRIFQRIYRFLKYPVFFCV